MSHRPDDANLPPIPDGGLSGSMPDWLRRPPAWRTLQDQEVVAPPPVETSALPEADESIIDPREFLTDDDLPAWLRRLGRGTADATRNAPGTSEADSTFVVAQPTPVAFSEEVPDQAASVSARFVPRQPVVLDTGRERPVVQPPRSATLEQPAPSAAWWQRGVVVMLLASLLVAAIVAIVVMAVV